jgi:heme-degrading monooxygenase HmoA
MVDKMRDFAYSKYSCLDFIAATKGEQEIAVSYWKSEDDIVQWRAHTEHNVAP